MNRKPTREKFVSSDYVLVMTPQIQNWHLNSDVYVQNKENMIDLEGNMIEPRHQTQIMIKDLLEFDNAIIDSAVKSAFG